MAVKVICTVIFLAAMLFSCSSGGPAGSPFYIVGDHGYRLFLGHETWFNAKETCEKLNSHLAIIRSDEESNLLYQHWKDATGPNSFSPELVAFRNKDFLSDWNEGSWIGLRDVDHDRSFSEWIDGSDVTYTNWKEGQPDDYWEQEDCVAIWNNGHDDATRQEWNDFDCNDKRPFFCQKDL